MRRAAALAIFLAGLMSASSALADDNPKLKSRRTKYKVKIDSAPQRAAIYLDDKKYGIVGYTPWNGRLISGTWKIIIEAEGYEPATKSIRVYRRRSTQEHFLPLVKKEQPAVVEVRADADKNAFNSQVWIDGQMRGTVPLTAKLPDGRHLVEIKKDGFETFSQWVDVKEGDRLAIQPMLKAIVKEKYGEIFVEADVADAEVYIDGNKHPDTTPTVIRKVVVGPHIIEVRKDPAIPWKQTVQVEEGKPFKVRAELKATISGPSGKIRVLSNVEKARVYLDGKDMGEGPLDLSDVKPGEHVIEVKAPGYMTSEKRVTVGAGDAQVLKFVLQPEATAATGKLKVVSRVPEAVVYLDGQSIGQVPQEKDVKPGDHFVVVEKKGFTKFEKKIRIEAGQEITVSAELKAVGGINIVSTPAGAEVMIDGVPTGEVTPFKKTDIDVGQHIFTLRYDQYYNYEKTISIEGGEMQVVRATLEKIDTGPTPAELAREQKGLTSFGARVLPRGRTTLDLYGGYPYLAGLRFTVGAGDLAGRPFDFGASFRTYFSRTEILGTLRLNLAERDPFSAGLVVTAGGSSNFVDDSARNGFFADLGAMASLSGLGSVTITGASYLNIYSDRHCPSYDADTMTFEDGFTPLGVCEGYANDTLSMAQKERVEELVGTDPFDRDTSLRLMLSITVEIAIKQKWNIWGQFEGAPFQDERAAFVDEFSGVLFDEDIGTYFRLGTTYKF
jgi:hypothetical protein